MDITTFNFWGENKILVGNYAGRNNSDPLWALAVISTYNRLCSYLLDFWVGD